MMGKRQYLHINLHSSHFGKLNSLCVSYLQRDTADLKSADRNWSWGFKSPSGHHLSCLLSILYRLQVCPLCSKRAPNTMSLIYPFETEQLILESTLPVPQFSPQHGLLADPGVNVTVIVQFAPTASELPQLFDCPKLLAFVPV